MSDRTNATELRELLEQRIAEARESLVQLKILRLSDEMPEAKLQIARLQTTLHKVEEALTRVPAIEVALLGPSRHGKSTLLNALTATSILPTSDVKPCTASIVSLQNSNEWFVEINFISRSHLVAEREQAVRDAEDYLTRLRNRDLEGEEPDDPGFLRNTLQRFIQLLDIDPKEQSSERLVAAVRNTEFPERIDKLLGNKAVAKATDLPQLRNIVEKYLSTKDVYWTIANSCEIRGPFAECHQQLRLIDLPGTNDTNSHRTAITNSLREKAQAVAIVTTDSNLGVDIESWLRNSTVLSDFLEARRDSYQRLFIIRTKFDSFHPEVDERHIDPDDEESEERLYREAIEHHKSEQKKSYHAMLRDIASPLMPIGSTPEEKRKVEELAARIEEIEVFFVSALAHEAFEGRLRATSRQKQRLSEHFNDDPRETGVPGLRDFLNDLAEQFLTRNYYEDLLSQLDREVDRLVHFFRKQGQTIEAQLAGAGMTVLSLVDKVESEVVPWMRDEARKQRFQFQESTLNGSGGIRQRLAQAQAMAEVRLRDKKEKWACFAWNSLKAAARKRGEHTTCRGMHIDINQDVCSVLVDDLIVAWTSYRDFLIHQQISSVTDQFSRNLTMRLQACARELPDQKAEAAVNEIIGQLSALAHSHRLELLQAVDLKVKQVESIRDPAYQIVQQTLRPIYDDIERQCGTGCQQRMREILIDGFNRKLPAICSSISALINHAIEDLTSYCSSALDRYAENASTEIGLALQHAQTDSRAEDRQTAVARLSCVNGAVADLPALSNR